MKRLGRAAYLIEVNGTSAVLKAEPPPPPAVWRRILRRITGGSLPFQNEMKVTTHVASMNLQGLSVPTLIGVTDSNQAVYSLLPGKDSRRLSPLQRDLLAAGLVRINAMARPPRFPWWKEVLFLALDAPLLLTLRRLVKSGLSLRSRLKATQFLLFYSLQTRFRRPALLHNDLVIGNVLVSDDDGVALIDFEDAVYDRRFVLADAVDIAFDSTQQTLDLHWLRRYAGAMASAGFDELSDEELLMGCVRACLIRHCAHRMVSSRLGESERLEIRRFTETVLINSNSYLRWFREQHD